MPTISIYDASTGQTIERDMTAEELEQHEIDKSVAPEYPEVDPPA
jgi:hypothetical protein